MSTQVLRSSRQPESYGNSRRIKVVLEATRRQEFTADIPSDSSTTARINSLPLRDLGDNFGSVTRCGQIRQPQAYLGTRHACRLFYSYPPKIGMTSCLALQELYATVTHFSLSGYELFKLTFKLHSGTISPNSTPDRVLKSYLLDRPALRSYENQTRVFGTTFDRKERQTEPKPVKEKLLAEKHPRGFKEPPVTCSTPEQAHYLPLPSPKQALGYKWQ